jgi:hypothetical protein
MVLEMEYEVTLANDGTEEEIALQSLPKAFLSFGLTPVEDFNGLKVCSHISPKEWLDDNGECLDASPQEFDRCNPYVVNTNLCFDSTMSRDVQPIYHVGSGKPFQVIRGPMISTIKVSRVSGQWCTYLVYTPELFKFFKQEPRMIDGETRLFIIIWYKVPKALLLPFTNVPLF